MAWFEKEMNFARDRLAEASHGSIDHAAEKLGQVLTQGVTEANQALRDVVVEAGREIDAKLDKISTELHNQRQFTKDDVRELVDYAAVRLSDLIDARLAVAKAEFSSLVQEKVEYFKTEVDDFFVRRQQDLARERRRLMINIALAMLASLLVGAVSWFYHRYLHDGGIDLYTVFRIALASLVVGYGVWLAVKLVRRYLSLSEHRKDLLFLSARYWGVLRPESLFGTVLMLALAAMLLGLLLFPGELARLPGGAALLDGIRDTFGFKR
jgi:hypothetical protein